MLIQKISLGHPRVWVRAPNGSSLREQNASRLLRWGTCFIFFYLDLEKNSPVTLSLPPKSWLNVVSEICLGFHHTFLWEGTGPQQCTGNGCVQSLNSCRKNVRQEGQRRACGTRFAVGCRFSWTWWSGFCVPASNWVVTDRKWAANGTLETNPTPGFRQRFAVKVETDQSYWDGVMSTD